MGGDGGFGGCCAPPPAAVVGVGWGSGADGGAAVATITGWVAWGEADCGKGGGVQPLNCGGVGGRGGGVHPLNSGGVGCGVSVLPASCGNDLGSPIGVPGDW